MAAKKKEDKLKSGAIIETDDKPKLQRRAIMKMTNDITMLPTYEILWRLVKRHKLGLWQLTAISAWLAIAWQVIA